jgi:hypothetical protein
MSTIEKVEWSYKHTNASFRTFFRKKIKVCVERIAEEVECTGRNCCADNE